MNTLRRSRGVMEPLSSRAGSLQDQNQMPPFPVLCTDSDTMASTRTSSVTISKTKQRPHRAVHCSHAQVPKENPNPRPSTPNHHGALK